MTSFGRLLRGGLLAILVSLAMPVRAEPPAPPPAPSDAKPRIPQQPLPDPDSAGAKLVARYCVQCHSAPSPTLLTSPEWGRVVNRMHLRIDTRVTPTETPSEEELKAILAYMKQHAR